MHQHILLIDDSKAIHPLMSALIGNAHVTIHSAMKPRGTAALTLVLQTVRRFALVWGMTFFFERSTAPIVSGE